MNDLLYRASPWILPVLMLLVLTAAIELPYRVRALLYPKKVNPDPTIAVQAALLTLSAFVLGLSFSQASARFDARRAIVLSEANAIGTTWLRANQLKPTESRRFRQILTDSTAAGLTVYQSPYDPDLLRRTTDRADRDQEELWSIVSSALRSGKPSPGVQLLMQSLNTMIDTIAQERYALENHVPTAIVVLTLCLVTLGALSLGLRFAMSGTRPLILSLVYVIAYVIVIEMMIDYDRPNNGFVTVSLTPLTQQLQVMQRER